MEEDLSNHLIFYLFTYITMLQPDGNWKLCVPIGPSQMTLHDQIIVSEYTTASDMMIHRILHGPNLRPMVIPINIPCAFCESSTLTFRVGNFVLCVSCRTQFEQIKLTPVKDGKLAICGNDLVYAYGYLSQFVGYKKTTFTWPYIDKSSSYYELARDAYMEIHCKKLWILLDYLQHDDLFLVILLHYVYHQ